MQLPRIVLTALEDKAACALREAWSEADRDPKLAAASARCAAECLDILYAETVESLKTRQLARDELTSWADDNERVNPDDARTVRDLVANAQRGA